ncbi:MAG: LuxR C-terminal-related transcriptional regulator, partial [Ktedonobacteraceae bacterium]
VEAVKPGFALTEQNAPLIAELCVRLGGVPLAIELAAARCKLLSLEALLARLKQGLEVLTGGKQNVPSRQQTLRNTIAWSYALLSAEEQLFFRRLCIFVGEFTLEAAEAVATSPTEISLSVLDGVISLVDKSLLQQREEENHEPRLYLLENIRAFGLEQLAERGELEDCRQAHAAYYLTFAEQPEGSLRGAGQIAWLGQAEMEYENIRAALQWFLEHHELEAALRLPIALRQFWFLRGRLSEGRTFLEQALEASRQDKRLQMSSLRARGFYVAGYLASRQQDLVLAASHLAAGLEMFRYLQDKGGVAACLSRLGFIQYIRGEVAQGKAKIAESLALSQEIGDRRNSAEVWHSLGTGALYQGRYSEARKQLEQGLAFFEAEDDVWGKANELHQLGITFFAQKDYARARQFSEESLALLQTMGSPYGTSETLTVLACTLATLGELTRAQGLLEEALTQASMRESTEDLVRVLCGVAYVELQQGDLAAARASLEEGLTKIRGRWFDPRSKWGLAGCLELLGELSLTQGHAVWAVQLCAAAETIRGVDGYYSLLGREQASYKRAMAEARRQLGEKVFAAAWAEGQALTPQQVIAAIVPSSVLEEAHPAAQTSQQVVAASTLPGGLTAREVEVLRLLAQGLSNHQIAEQLVLSPYTVNSHTQSIYGKLGINTRSAATRFAVDHHLL